MVDFSFGTPLVYLVTSKMKKPSYKDLIIALGVVVAAFIIVTSLYFKDGNTERNSMKVGSEKKIKPAAILKAVVKKFSSHSSI
jgi:hypothetical protein